MFSPCHWASVTRAKPRKVAICTGIARSMRNFVCLDPIALKKETTKLPVRITIAAQRLGQITPRHRLLDCVAAAVALWPAAMAGRACIGHANTLPPPCCSASCCRLRGVVHLFKSCRTAPKFRRCSGFVPPAQRRWTLGFATGNFLCLIHSNTQ
jgi:hypothetical protein